MGMAQDNGQAVLLAGDFTSARPDDNESGGGSEFDLKYLEKLSARDVPVNALSSGVYLRRGGTNAAHVHLLIDAAGSAQLPPVLIQQDGCRVIDGLHRLEAAKLRGEATIKARFLDCTDSEALVLAMKTNSTHGLPLSKADRLAGAQHVLTAHPDWSDRAIAAITGLSAKTIASLRNQSADTAPLGGKRLGRRSSSGAGVRGPWPHSQWRAEGSNPHGRRSSGTASLRPVAADAAGRQRPSVTSSRREVAPYRNAVELRFADVRSTYGVRARVVSW